VYDSGGGCDNEDGDYGDDVQGVFNGRPNFLNYAPTGNVSALRLLGAHSGRF
jgi:hypothetical protein